MRSLRFLFASARGRALLVLAPGALLSLASARCAGGDESKNEPPAEVGAETTETIDSGTEETAPDAPMEAAPDTAPPDAPTSVTCSKSPAYGAPIRVNHNPDSLRRVANAGMVLLDDGRIVVAMLEAVDTGSRHALWARLVEPTTGAFTPDERLDVDADGLTDSSAFQIFAIQGGAVGVRFGDGHLRVYAKGKWSPDLAGSMPIASGDELGFLANGSGQVLVTRARAATPSGQAIVYRPDEGGAKGSWSALQSLDLDGSSGKPRIDRAVLSDDRFLTMTWQGGGGPAIRTRSLSGSWGTASAKAEIGAADASPQYRLLADNSIVLVGLEGSGDTRRVVTSTWTATDNWSTARLLSKPTSDTNGVVPLSSGPLLFPVSGTEVEFVAWVAACAGVAKECEFSAVSRRYSAGTWKDPVDLGVGDKRNGAEGTGVIRLDDGAALVVRFTADRKNASLRVGSAGTFTAKMDLVSGSPLFGDSTEIEARAYGTADNLWTLVRRVNVTAAGPATVLAMALGRVDAKAGTVTWSPVTAGAFELRNFSGFFPYADGAGGFTVGAAAATDGMSTAPIVAHSNTPGGMLEAASVISSDESAASFVAVPRAAPRPGLDRSAVYVVSAKPTDPGNRLRAYAYNGVSGAVPKVLANETRAPRTFADSLLQYGCGGAILYAADPVDGSHTLELVLVREAASSTGDAG